MQTVNPFLSATGETPSAPSPENLRYVFQSPLTPSRPPGSVRCARASYSSRPPSPTTPHHDHGHSPPRAGPHSTRPQLTFMGPAGNRHGKYAKDLDPFFKDDQWVIDKSVFSVSKSSSQFLETSVAYKQLDMNMLQRLAQQSRILQMAMEQAQCGNMWPMSTLNDGCRSVTKRVSSSLLLLCNGRLRFIIRPVVSLRKTQSPRVGQHDKNIQGRLLWMPWLNGLLQMTRYSYFALLHGCTH